MFLYALLCHLVGLLAKVLRLSVCVLVGASLCHLVGLLAKVLCLSVCACSCRRFSLIWLVCLQGSLFVGRSVFLEASLSDCLSVGRSACRGLCVSVSLLPGFSVCLPVFLQGSLSVCQLVCLCSCRVLCLSVFLQGSLSVCLPVFLQGSLSVGRSVCRSVSLQTDCLFVCLFASLSVCLSVGRSACRAGLLSAFL